MRSQVYFGYDDEEGNFQEETKTDVLFGHFLHTHVGTNDDNSKIRGKTGEAVDCSFEVLLMATKVSNGDDFMAVSYDFFPVLVFVLVEPFGQDLFAFFVEAHDFVSY